MIRRGSVYWVRFRVPDALRRTMGRGELKRSLGTGSYRLAHERTLRATLWWRSFCQLSAMQQIDAAQAESLVRDYFASLIASTKLADIARPPEPDQLHDEGAWAAEEAASALREAIAAGELDSATESDFAQFLESKGVELNQLGKLRASAILGAMAARVEHARYFQHRMDRPLAPYVLANEQLVVPTGLSAPPIDQDGACGTSISTAVAAYKSERAKTWAPRTVGEYNRVLGWVTEHFGPNRDIGTLKKQDAATFRAALIALEKRSTKPTFKERQTDDPAKRIAARTASKYLELASAFFEWAASDAGLIENSPFAKIAIPFKKGKSGAANAATSKAIQAFLTSPLFQGHCKGKPHKKGPVVERGEQYWLLLLQLFIGARAGEVVQLRASDVQAVKGTPAIIIRATDDYGAAVAGKLLKTQAASRDVPLPQNLIQLGFLDYATAKAGTSKDALLFPSFAPSKGQNWSAKATKFTSRYLVRIGQKQPGKANHWLRHAWTDAMKDGGVEDSIIAQLEGHAEAGMKAVYGKGNNWLAKMAAIDKANFEFDPLELLLASKKRWSHIKA